MPLIRKPPSGSPAAAAPVADLGAVLSGLSSGSDEERWSAARAAADIPESVAGLGSALSREQSPVVREALFSALARIATPQSVEAVLPLLRSDDALLRTGATDALVAMKQAAWPYVAALLRDADADVRVLAGGLVREMPREAAGALCGDVLDSEPEPNVCAAIVEVLAEIGEPSVLPALRRCAERFRATPFLAFAIDVAIDRLRSQGSS